MRGWLVVNAYLRTQKFQELYDLLRNACRVVGASLEVKTNDELLSSLQSDKKTPSLPQFALFWDKDVYLARRLERLGVRLFNSAAAVEACDNKILTALALQAADIPTPETFLVPKTFPSVGYTSWRFLDEAERALGYPMVLKEAYGSFGAQVYLLQDRAAAEEKIAASSGKDLLLQRFVAASRGRDIRVNVVGDEAVCAIERVNERDFRSNITNGGRGTIARITDETATLAVRACRAVGADFAGVDVLFDDDGSPLVCEVNSNPHFKSTLDITGVDVGERILRYIRGRV